MWKAKRKVSLLVILCMFAAMLPVSAMAEDSPGDSAAPSSGEDFVEVTPETLAAFTAEDVDTRAAIPADAEKFGNDPDNPTGFFKDGTLTILDNNLINDNNWEALKKRVTKLVISYGVSSIPAAEFAGMDKLTDNVKMRTPVVEYTGTREQWDADIVLSGNNAGSEWGFQAGEGNHLLVSFADGGMIGKCGENVCFSFEKETDTNGALVKGTLTISKTDDNAKEWKIADFEEYMMPWYSIRGLVTDLVIEDGITDIGSYAFYSFTNLHSVIIPEDIASIGEYAFAHCTKMNTLEIVEAGPDLEIERYAFYDCTSLENLGRSEAPGIPTRVKKIGQAAFRDSGLVYTAEGTTGNIYYSGDREAWKQINDDGNSPDIRTDKLLTGPINNDETVYAIVHYTGNNVPEDMYCSLSFLRLEVDDAGAENYKLDVGSLEPVSGIVSKPVVHDGKAYKIAENTKFTIPGIGDVKREGYTFTGWRCSIDNKIYQPDEKFAMPAEEVTFTAQWKVDEPVKGEATGDTIQSIIEYLEDADRRGKPGYYWTVPQDSASTRTELIKCLDMEDDGMVAKRLEAYGAVQGLDISYRVQVKSFIEATMGVANMTKGRNGSFAFELHLTFKSGNDVIMATAHIKNGVIEATEYENGKTDKAYKVTFAPGGGDDTGVLQTHEDVFPGKSFTLPECKYGPPAGKEFSGWRCSLTGLADSFADKLFYRENAQFTMRASDVTFTAEWKDIPKDNGGAAASAFRAVAAQGVPQPKVNNLRALARSELEAQKDVSVILEAAAVGEDSPDAAKIKTASSEENLTFVDLTIHKTVDGKTSRIPDTNGELVEVTLPFDGKNAENVKVYRVHDDEVDVLTAGGSGERIAVTDDSVTIYAEKFSVYAIAFDRKDGHAGAATTGGNSSTNSGSSAGNGSSSNGGGSIGNGGDSTSGGSGKGGSSKPDIASREDNAPVTGGAGSSPAAKRFNDVPPEAWYYEAANWAYDNKIAKGEGGRRFNPNKLCTRAEMLTFLWRSLGSPEPQAPGKTFSDVSSGSYYAKAVQWAAGQNIVKGSGGKRFNPDAPITRAEAITFLYRTLGAPASSGTRFQDVPESAYYAEAVEWAAGRDIAKGMGKRSFNPSAPCTRAQVLTFLYRSQS